MKRFSPDSFPANRPTLAAAITHPSPATFASLVVVIVLLLTLLVPSAALAAEETDVVFVIDSSASMSREVEGVPAADPRGLRHTAVRTLVALAPSSMRVGLVNLSDELSAREGLAKPDALHTGLVHGLTSMTPEGKASVLRSLGEMKTTEQAGLEDGYTYIDSALGVSQRVMGASTATRRYIFVITDGEATGEDPTAWKQRARDLQASGVTVVLFRLGTGGLTSFGARELAALHDDLAVTGGGVEMVENADELVTYYLQRFTTLDQNVYLNQLAIPANAANQPTLGIVDWMNIDDAFLIVPTSGEGKIVSALVSLADGRDVLNQARGSIAGASDDNVEILALNRAQLGKLEGDWAVRVTRDVPNARLIVRSRVRIDWQAVAQPEDVVRAVVAATIEEGQVKIPRRQVVARVGDATVSLADGALRPGLFSGAVDAPGDGQVSIRVRAAPEPNATRPDLAPWLEKSFAITTSDVVASEDVSLALAKVKGEGEPLLPGEAVQVSVEGGTANCTLAGAAVRVEPGYVTVDGLPPPPSQGAFAPPGAGGVFAFVPLRPGNVQFRVDHALLTCEGAPLPVGVARDGVTAAMLVDMVREVKIERVTETKLPTNADLNQGVEIVVRSTVASWRPEPVQIHIEGLAGAVVTPGVLGLTSQPNPSRPGPTVADQRIRVATKNVLPGGLKGAFTLTFTTQEGGQSRELGRYSYEYEVPPATLAVREARPPTLEPDGIHLQLALDGARLRYVPPAASQAFLVTVEGIASSIVSPSTVEVGPNQPTATIDLLLRSPELCRLTGRVPLTIGVAPLASPNGAIAVDGAPLASALEVPPMSVVLDNPAKIPNLNTTKDMVVQVRSSSLCTEAFQLRLVDPAAPERFTGPGLRVDEIVVAPGERQGQSVQIMLGQKPPRGVEGTALLEVEHVSGNPALVFPRQIPITYYTPFWTEEHPRRALGAFAVLTALLAAIGTVPRVFGRDPLATLASGETSDVTGRRNARWLLAILVIAAAGSAAIVWYGLASWL